MCGLVVYLPISHTTFRISIKECKKISEAVSEVIIVGRDCTFYYIDLPFFGRPTLSIRLPKHLFDGEITLPRASKSAENHANMEI